MLKINRVLVNVLLQRSKYFYITDIALLGTLNELPLMASLAVSGERREKINFLGLPKEVKLFDRFSSNTPYKLIPL